MNDERAGIERIVFGAGDGSVAISTVTDSGDMTTDAFGVEWSLETLEGWFDGWGGQARYRQRLGRPGAWVDPVDANQRTMKGTGWLGAPTWDAATAAWSRLLSAVDVSDLTQMTVKTGWGAIPTQQAMVRWDGTPRITSRFDGDLDFEFGLTAPDPRKYATTLSQVSTRLPSITGGFTFPITFPLTIGATVSSGVAQATNVGDTDAPVVLTVQGPCPPVAIRHLGSGARLVLPDAVPAGRSVLLDSDRRTATADTADGPARRVSGSWFDLAPGTNEIAWDAVTTDPAALLTVAWRHAWK